MVTSVRASLEHTWNERVAGLLRLFLDIVLPAFSTIWGSATLRLVTAYVALPRNGVGALPIHVDSAPTPLPLCNPYSFSKGLRAKSSCQCFSCSSTANFFAAC